MRLLGFRPILLAMLCMGTSGWLIRDVPSGVQPSHCSQKRDHVPCRSELEAALVIIRDSNSLSFGLSEIMRSVLPEGASEATVSCLRYELSVIRKSLFVTTCVFNELITWNRDDKLGTVREYVSFVHLAAFCRNSRVKENACQIHTWYDHVFARSVGRDIESLGLRETSIPIFATHDGDFVPVWAPNVSIGRAILDFELELIRPSDDGWIDALIESFGEDPVDSSILMPNARLADPPSVCGKMRRVLSCKADYQMALEYLRGIGEIPQVTQVMENLEFERKNKPSFSCVYGALWNFRNSLILDARSYNHLLALNRKNAPMSAKFFNLTLDAQQRSRCDLHLWYYIVINPNRGRTLSSVGIREVEDGFAPPRRALTELIDLELSRLPTP
jgi:hypothetical protein